MYFSPDGYIEYHAGNLPVILAAPHGGDMAPASIPDRTCLNAVTVNDGNTQVLARQIDTALCQRLGCYPHIVINRLARRKLDANRDLPEAACGNAAATQAWYAFHAFLDSAKAAVTQQYGRGIFIDLHGHAHALARLELGYLLTGSELRLGGDTLNGPAYTQQSSLRHLVDTNLQQATHVDLLRGPHALGSQLEAMSFDAVPSDSIPFPLPGEPYFNGGYNTARHGSVGGGTVDAVQIECPFAGVRDTYGHRKAFAASLAASLEDFLERFYFGDVFSSVISGGEQPCEQQSYNYSVVPLPGFTYVWTVGGGQILSGQGTASVEIKWDAPGDGWLKVVRLCP